jgi:hypothetical protein
MVSLTGEAGSLADVAPVMRDLLAAAQAGCDQHLAEQIAALMTGATAPPPALRPAFQPQANVQPRPLSRVPSQSRPAPRRGMPGATDSQIRLLRRLLGNDEAQIAAFCQEQGVGSLEAADVKRASAWIDDLKASGAVPA